MIRSPIASLLAISCIAGLVCAQHDDKPAAKPTIVQIATDAGDFHTLVAAVKAAGLAETLSGKGPFTVFAPTDAAFAKLGKDTIADLLKPENKQKLVSILTYHVVGDSVPAAKVVASKSLESLQGQNLAVTVKDGKVMIGSANVTKTDIMGSNGVIHVIDSVLLPPAGPNLVEVATKAGGFGTLLKAAVAAGLADTLAKDGPFTIFAPTDAAFAALGDDTLAMLLKPENKEKLASILKHHVVAGTVMAAQAVKLTEAKTIGGTKLALKVEGKTLTVGGAKVVKADVTASNGVIHVIDAVIVPAN
ncbi:MAG: fasciclin domain-containing protein [Planctomycetota bacterium]